MTETIDTRTDEEIEDGIELMRDGWILDFDGSIHAARTLDVAIQPAPHGMIVRLTYAMTEEQARMGLVRSVQVALDEQQVGLLALEMLDFRNKRRGAVGMVAQ